MTWVQAKASEPKPCPICGGPIATATRAGRPSTVCSGCRDAVGKRTCSKCGQRAFHSFCVSCLAAYQLEWRQKVMESSPWLVKARAAISRLRRLGAVVAAEDLVELVRAQGMRCPFTNELLHPDESTHLDHVTPVSRGGSSDLGNLRWVKTRVNLAKGQMLDDEFWSFCARVAVYGLRSSRRKREDARHTSGEGPYQ